MKNNILLQDKNLVNKIATTAAESLATGKVVGIALGGSYLLDANDNASDLDLIILTADRDLHDLTLQLSFYDPETKKLIDCLVRDLDALTKQDDDWILGWGGWVWYLTIQWKKQPDKIIIFDQKVNKVLDLAEEYKNLFIYDMILGYLPIISKLMSVNGKDLLTVNEAKAIYYLCMVYNMEAENIFNTDLLLRVKRNKFNQITTEELNQIKAALKKLRTKNTLEIMDQYRQTKQIKYKINQIWK